MHQEFLLDTAFNIWKQNIDRFQYSSKCIIIPRCLLPSSSATITWFGFIISTVLVFFVAVWSIFSLSLLLSIWHFHSNYFFFCLLFGFFPFLFFMVTLFIISVKSSSNLVFTFNIIWAAPAGGPTTKLFSKVADLSDPFSKSDLFIGSSWLFSVWRKWFSMFRACTDRLPASMNIKINWNEAVNLNYFM